jgi:hypothetical protein
MLTFSLLATSKHQLKINNNIRPAQPTIYCSLFALMLYLSANIKNDMAGLV